ncbi:MAG: FtsQ-type POTRA domain-containing protein, partial [Verrucomicrobiota bacterium]
MSRARKKRPQKEGMIRFRLVKKGNRPPPRRRDRRELDIREDSRNSQMQKGRYWQTRAARLVFLTMGVLAVVAISAFAMRQVFYENEEFQLRRIDVQTDGKLTSLQVEKAAELPPSVNLLKIDIRDVDARIRRLSQVRDVRVERILPATLRIVIEERRPRAWLAPDAFSAHVRKKDGYLLDGSGQLMRCDQLFREYLNLPIIRYPELEGRVTATVGSSVSDPRILTVLRFLGQADQVFDYYHLNISEIVLEKAFCFNVHCVNGLKIKFLTRKVDADSNYPDREMPFQAQFERLGALLQFAQTNELLLESVNLTPSKNIAYTCRPGSA